MRNNDYTYIENQVFNDQIIVNKKISIIIPFYRGADILENTLIGFINQTYPKELFEVIVSEDDTYGEAKSIIEKYSNHFNLSYVQRKRQGICVGSTRNNGIINAKGEVIIIIDFDMIPPPNYIYSHARWYHFSESVSVFGGRKFVDPKHIQKKQIIDDFTSFYSLPDVNSVSNKNCSIDNRSAQMKYIKKHPFPFNCFHGCNISFLKKHAIEIGLFDVIFDTYFGFEDIDFGLKLWNIGNYIVYDKDTLCFHQENNITNIDDRQLSSLRNLNILYKRAPEGFRLFRLFIGKQF